MKERKELSPSVKLKRCQKALDDISKDLKERAVKYNKIDRVAGFVDRILGGKSSSVKYKDEIKFVDGLKNIVEECQEANTVFLQAIAIDIRDCELHFPYDINQKLQRLKLFLHPSIYRKEVEMKTTLTTNMRH